MAAENAQAEAQADPNQPFYDKALTALRDLFEKAKAAQELHFAMSLMPELRGAQDGGWNTAEESVRAYDDFEALVKKMSKDDLRRVRVLLSFYLHVSEGSGFYEIPKKMMLTIEGKGNNLYPFQKLVKKYRRTGKAIAPNANAIMKDMMGHAYDLGLYDLSDIFKDAFDSDVRNAVAHADYTLVSDGMRLRRRNGGQPREIMWADLEAILCKGLNFFSFVRQIAHGYVTSYDPPKTIKSRMAGNEPITDWTIYYGPNAGTFGFCSAASPPTGYDVVKPQPEIRSISPT